MWIIGRCWAGAKRVRSCGEVRSGLTRRAQGAGSRQVMAGAEAPHLHQNGTSCTPGSRMEPFNGVYAAPIDRLGWPGRWLRHQLLRAILAGTPLLVALQKLHNPRLDKVMHVLSFLGTEEFYTPIVILLAWVIDARLARLFTILMGVGFYIATATKNLLRLPRPPSPPVQVLEVTYDWSFPSLHSIIGVMLPWYLAFYVWEHYHLPAAGIVTFFIIVALWSLSVNTSRMYLGVHSPADIIAGAVLGASTLYLYRHIDDYIDAFIQQDNSNASLVLLIFYTIMLNIHPVSEPPTHSFSESVITNTVAFGMVLGYRWTLGPEQIYYGALLDQVSTPPGLLPLLKLGLGRILLGFPMVLLTRVIFKPISKRLCFVVCKRVGITAYSYADYRRGTSQLNKHYSPGFKLPPLKEDKEEPMCNGNNVANHVANGDSGVNGMRKTNGTNSTNGTNGIHTNGHIYQTKGSYMGNMPFDVDTPVRFVTYTAMCLTATVWVHPLFHYLGLVF